MMSVELVTSSAFKVMYITYTQHRHVLNKKHHYVESAAYGPMAAIILYTPAC